MNEALHLARALRAQSGRVVSHHSRPVQLAKVVKVKPLSLELFEGKMILDEDDLIFPKAVKKRKLKAGEVVTVAQVHTDEYIVLTDGATAGAVDKGDAKEAEAIEKEEEEAEGGDSAAAMAALATDGVGMIVHGTNDSTARGSVYAHYIWVGAKKPLNALENDQWIKAT